MSTPFFGTRGIVTGTKKGLAKASPFLEYAVKNPIFLTVLILPKPEFQFGW